MSRVRSSRSRSPIGATQRKRSRSRSPIRSVGATGTGAERKRSRSPGLFDLANEEALSAVSRAEQTLQVTKESLFAVQYFRIQQELELVFGNCTSADAKTPLVDLVLEYTAKKPQIISEKTVYMRELAIAEKKDSEKGRGHSRRPCTGEYDDWQNGMKPCPKTAAPNDNLCHTCRIETCKNQSRYFFITQRIRQMEPIVMT